MTSDMLTVIPQHGALMFRYGKYVYTYDGWYWVDGKKVMRSNYLSSFGTDPHGFCQCDLRDVIEFTSTKEKT